MLFQRMFQWRQIVISDSSGFLGILNGMYDLVIIDVHAMAESYFIVLNALFCELNIYKVIVTCLNRACYACYAVIWIRC